MRKFLKNHVLLHTTNTISGRRIFSLCIQLSQNPVDSVPCKLFFLQKNLCLFLRLLLAFPGKPAFGTDLRRDRNQPSRKSRLLRRFFHLHSCCCGRKGNYCSNFFLTHLLLLLNIRSCRTDTSQAFSLQTPSKVSSETQKQDTEKLRYPVLLILFISYEDLPDYLAWIYPLAFRVSAQRTAPPAAPLTVLWESPMNL